MSSTFETLRRFAKARAPVERCDLCAQEIGPDHDHLIEPGNRSLVCACIACALLFSRQSGSKYKRVPRQVLQLEDVAITDAQWEGLRLPINLAFFYYCSPQARMIACYPSPAGATESLLELDTWEEIRSGNPVLADLQPDVQALLVNRVRRGATLPVYLLVPIDQCFRLVGLIRTHWKGLSGGTQVWEEIDRFFAGLIRTARPATEGHRA